MTGKKTEDNMDKKQECTIAINETVFKILVRPNSPKNRISGIDEQRNAFRVEIAAPPDKDKANKEVIKFFSKLLKKKVRIVKGMRSREKLLKVE